ncbi:MAG: hypothetical protein K5985_03280 [Lachnospiraceae bacterium]|nr:hypothetical protein [Lachnospiraceae bacterium]
MEEARVSSALPKDNQIENDAPEASGSEKPERTKEEMTDDFISKLSSEAKADRQDIRYSLVDDFDMDGKYEGFFFIGGDVDEEWGSCDGEVWFVNEGRAEKIHSTLAAAVNEDSNVFKIVEGADKNFAAFNEMYATSNVTYLFYADGDECKESEASGIGAEYIDEKTGDMVITFSAYDGCCDYEAGSDEPMWTGHTWKPYYFYYDRNTGDFIEYEAQDISAKELSDILGTDLAGDLEGQGYVVDRMIRRNNGIINVNYSEVKNGADGSKSITYRNATFDERTGDFENAWGDDETGVSASDFGGIYYLQISSPENTAESGLPDRGGDYYGVFVMLLNL